MKYLLGITLLLLAGCTQSDPGPELVDSERFVARESWDADDTRPNTTPMKAWTRITVHHSAVADQRGEPAAAIAKTLQHRHQDERGWADIGVHFVIGADGKIAEGRPLHLQGAHVSGQNEGNIGILIGGDFDDQRVTPAAKKALAHLLDALQARYDIPASAVHTHAELAGDGCPGRHLQRVVDGLRAGG